MATTQYTVTECEAILAQLEDASLRLASGTPEVSMHIDALGEQLTLSPDNLHKMIDFWETRRDRATEQAAGGTRGSYRGIALSRRRPA